MAIPTEFDIYFSGFLEKYGVLPAAESIWDEATRQAREHERLAVEQAVASSHIEIDRLHQICLDVMRERDEAVAVIVERLIQIYSGDGPEDCPQTWGWQQKDYIAAARALSPDSYFMERERLKARLEEAKKCPSVQQEYLADLERQLTAITGEKQ